MSFTFGTTPSAGNSQPAFGGATGFSFGGSSNNAPAGGGAFGSSTASNAFGAQNATGAQSGFSFGNSGAAAPASSGFSFGGANTNQPNSSGFNFGSTPSNQNTTASSGGFSFGNSTAPKSPGTGGFGTSGFGSLSSPSTNQNNASSGCSFGQNAAGSNSLSFGSSANALNKPTGLSFGSPTTSAPSFGNLTSPNNNSSFASFSFANNNKPAAPSFSGFSTGFGAAPLQNANQQSARSQGPVFEAIEKLERAYAPLKDINGNYIAKGDGKKNDECHFKTIILNQKPSQINQFQQPQQSQFPQQQQQQQQLQQPIRTSADTHLIYGALLEEVEKDNIDPSNYIPVEEIGIEALKQRFENQNKEINNMNEYIVKLKDLMKSIDETNRNIRNRINALKMKQLPLNQKLLFILRKIEILRCHGNPLQISEKHFQNHLFNILRELEFPKKKLEDISVNLVRISFIFFCFPLLLLLCFLSHPLSLPPSLVPLVDLANTAEGFVSRRNQRRRFDDSD